MSVTFRDSAPNCIAFSWDCPACLRHNHRALEFENERLRAALQAKIDEWREKGRRNASLHWLDHANELELLARDAPPAADSSLRVEQPRLNRFGCCSGPDGSPENREGCCGYDQWV